MKLAGKQDRLINFIVDKVIIVFLILVILFILSFFIDPFGKVKYIILAVITFTYYIYFEARTGKTPGKIISKTKVVDKTGKKAGVMPVMFRTLIRLTGIIPFVFLFGTEVGIHDLVTKTRVISDK